MKRDLNYGFTLVEIMVAVSIFAVVAVICTGAFITANNVNKKAQAIKLVMDNLNFALDSMSLKIRRSGPFLCDDETPSSLPSNFPPDYCPEGGTFLAMKTKGNLSPSGTEAKYFAYRLNGTTIEYNDWTASEGFNPGGFAPITMAEAQINGLQFRAYGDEEGTQRARIVISISGVTQVGGQNSAFNIQTTVSER